MTRPGRRALQLYRVLLRAYPRAFRAAFAAQMERTFEVSLEEVGTPGGKAVLWARTVFDLVRSVPREHWDEWTHGTGGGDMRDVLDDVRTTVRSLAKAPTFTVTALATLTLGIGATTALYTVVDGVLLTPLPYPEPERVVLVSEELEDGTGLTLSNSYLNGMDWKAATTAFDHLALFLSGTLTATGEGEARNLSARFVDPEYFAILGVEPAVGRLPGVEDNRHPGAHPLVVISHALWLDRFDGVPDVLGRALELSGQPHTVIGVLPAAHREPLPGQSGGEIDLWIPSMMAGGVDPRGDALLTLRAIRIFGMLGRLAPGQTLVTAEADLDRIADRLEELHPGENRGIGARVQGLGDVVTDQIRGPVVLLLSGALVLLAIACFNVANLLLVRGSTRTREVSVHLALGAGRIRVARKLAIEGLLLACGGALLGGLAAATFLPGLLAMVPTQLPVVADVALDGSVALVVIALTMGVAAGVGVAPALRVSSVDLRAAMSSARSATGDRFAERARRLLIVLELSTATVLLAATVLLVRTFDDIASQEPGFETERVLTAQVTLARGRYPDLTSLAAGIEAVTNAVAAVPGVEWVQPWGPGRPGSSLFLQSSVPDGREVGSFAESPVARRQHVGPGALADMGIDILAGRDISSDDRLDSERVAVVGESMARALWPGQSPLGQVFRGFTPAGQPHDPSRTWVVVGVARDAGHAGRVPGPGSLATANDAYFPIQQRPERSFTLLVRTRGEPDAAPVRRAIAAFDPDIPVFGVTTLPELLEREEAPARFAALLMSAFGLSALVLAALGVYGILSYTVAERTREIGLRAALGAGRGRTLWHVLGDGARLAAGGVSLGGLAAAGMAAFAPEDTTLMPTPDAGALVVAGATLFVIALLACAIPAVRAGRVEPVVALRE